MSQSSPAFSILTWGCQMNEDDSDQMASLLMQMGYSPASDIEDADIILLNTCSVRAKPEHKVSTKLGELRSLKKRNPELIIGVCGCMAQRQGMTIRKRAPHVDMVVGTAQIERLPELICEVQRSRHPLSALELPRSTRDEAAVPVRTTPSAAGHLKAFVPVTYGCDNFCAYCVVPYVRGKERSRPIPEITDEVRQLVASGCREITLLGQNVNSYRSPNDADAGFPHLLTLLARTEGLRRIRFMTSHPKDLSEELIRVMATEGKVCKHIHLPIQAGDDDVLKAMRRGYTVSHYLGLIDALRGAMPDIAITTDILIGFPGETEDQFRNTLRAIEAVRFDAAFMFAFNAIAGTAAAALPDQLPPQVKNDRLRQVIELQNRITIEKNREDIGRTAEIMVEGMSPKDPNRMTGLTSQNKTVNFPSTRHAPGEMVTLQLTEAHLYGFVGQNPS